MDSSAGKFSGEKRLSSLVYTENQCNFKPRSLHHLRKPKASFHSLPWEKRHWGLPSRILEAQAKLVSLVGLCGPDGNPARGWEKEWHGETKLQWARPIALFSTGVLNHKLHIEDNRGCEIMQSQQSLILIETRVSFLQTYRIQMV